jgi:hypothetical protein
MYWALFDNPIHGNTQMLPRANIGKIQNVAQWQFRWKLVSAVSGKINVPRPLRTT